MTTPKHPDAADFVWYVCYGVDMTLRDWPSARITEFEDHMDDCRACAERLAAEARDQLVLEDLAREAPKEKRRFSSAWACAGVAAIFLVFAFGVSRAASPPPYSDTSSQSISPLDAGLLLADGDLAQPAQSL